MATNSFDLPDNVPVIDAGGNTAMPWSQWFSRVQRIVAAAQASGTTANRPTDGLWIGRRYFDTTLGQPVWVSAVNPTVWATAGGGGGTGDVVGPAGAVNNRVVFFNGTTGKLIKDSGLTLSGTNTGDQTITLTGNVTGSGTGSFATTIAAGVVTLAMQANVATSTLFYRKTAGAGAPEVQTLATLKTDLGLTGTNSGDQTISIAGDATAAGSTGVLTATVTKVNGVSFAGLATGILKNTTGTGVPSIAIAADFPTLNQNTTGSAATLTTPRNINGTAFNGSADITVTVPVATGVSGLGAGIATWLATASSANLLAALTTKTGTGLNVFDTSPTLITPLLGTPTSGTLTNCTGYTVANLSGLGANVGTFLATPSSANLAAAVTDETGTGALVFGTNPTINNPVITGNEYLQQGAPTSLAAAATLTAAQMLGGMIQYTGAAGALTLPTGTLMDAAVVSGLAVDRAFEVCFIVTGAGAATVTAGVGFTLVGAGLVAAGTSARFRCRRTAANTFIAYRV